VFGPKKRGNFLQYLGRIKGLRMKSSAPASFALCRRNSYEKRRATERPTTIHPSAWDFFTAYITRLVICLGEPLGLSPGSCYIGIQLFRPLDEDDSLRGSSGTRQSGTQSFEAAWASDAARRPSERRTTKNTTVAVIVLDTAEVIGGSALNANLAAAPR
jgi:hypothetical protein